MRYIRSNGTRPSTILQEGLASGGEIARQMMAIVFTRDIEVQLCAFQALAIERS